MITTIDQIKGRIVDISTPAFLIACKVIGNASGAVLVEVVDPRYKERIGCQGFVSFKNFQFQVDEEKLALADYRPFIKIFKLNLLPKQK